MAEHFNIAVAFGHVIPLESRPEVLRTLARIYTPFFDGLHEVCRNNYKDGTSQCEKWPAGEVLLKTKLGGDELLFIYGEKSERSAGARSSIHVEENDSGMVFVVSLPMSSDVTSLQLEQFVLATKKSAEQLSDFFIVAAGWELEYDATEKMEDSLRGCFADTSLCSWIAAPKRVVRNWPSTFVKVSESDQVIVLKNSRGA